MRQKIIYIILGIVVLVSGAFWSEADTKVRKPKITFKLPAVKIMPLKEVKPPNKEVKPPKETLSEAPTQKKVMDVKIPVKKITVNNVALKQVSFAQLPGWSTVDVHKSLTAFKKSCETFLKQNPKKSVGSTHLNLKAKDWHPACKAALKVNALYEKDAKKFFKKWFYPIEFTRHEPVKGIFTGYYMPSLKGSLTKTKQYTIPIYGVPKNLSWHSRRHRYFTRQEIDNGALKNKAPIIAWVNSPVERLFLGVEGSGIIRLPNGNLYLGYAGQNGAPYTSVGNVLINRGIISRDKASKKAIKTYLEKNPQKGTTIMHKNKSFVFFQKLDESIALGAQGMALTPGYSLAVDNRWIPLGAPLWLATRVPVGQTDTDKNFQRLMIAQDTGGAIHGIVRGDIYWGSGKRAAYLGEHMRNHGRYWLLLPKHYVDMKFNA